MSLTNSNIKVSPNMTLESEKELMPPKTKVALVDKLDAAIEDFNKKSDALFDAELKLAETYQELTLPLKEPFRRIQKHTEFRSSLYSLFAEALDYEILQYEKLVENSNDKF